MPSGGAAAQSREARFTTAAEHGEVEPVAGADRPHHHLAGGDAEADVQVPLGVRLEQVGERALDLEAAGDGVALHAGALEHGHDLVADELVDVAAVALDDGGLGVEVLVQHLHHDLGGDGLDEGGVAADVGEQHRGAAPRPAAGDAAGLGGADRGHRLARDELHQLEALAELPDHRVHPAREVADLVAGSHALDPRGQVAGADPGRDLADLQDRAGEPAGEEERGRGGDAEAGEADEQQVAQHVVDDRIGVVLAELGDDRPGEGLGKGVGAEHRLAVGPDVALDRLRARAGHDQRRRVRDDRPVGERARLRLEHGAAGPASTTAISPRRVKGLSRASAPSGARSICAEKVTSRPASCVRSGKATVASQSPVSSIRRGSSSPGRRSRRSPPPGCATSRPGRGRRRRGGGRSPGR